MPGFEVRNPKATGSGKDGTEGATRPWIEAAMERGYHEKDGNDPVTDAAKQWDGYGTALKPALEPICLARKPLSEATIAANVLKWGCGALNIDGCRVGTDGGCAGAGAGAGAGAVVFGDGLNGTFAKPVPGMGRWPANIIHDGSEEVVAAFPDAPGQQQAARDDQRTQGDVYGKISQNGTREHIPRNDSGSAARFFYSSKADQDDRLGSKHPTVKPLDLMQYLVRLITPPRGIVLDCFGGTGTTGEAAFREGFRAVLIEREAEYQDDIRRRMKLALSGPGERAREAIKQKTKDKPPDHGPLFGGNAETMRGGAGRYTATSPTKTDDRANRNDEMVTPAANSAAV